MELSTRGSGATLRTAALTLGPPRRAGRTRGARGAPSLRPRRPSPQSRFLAVTSCHFPGFFPRGPDQKEFEPLTAHARPHLAEPRNRGPRPAAVERRSRLRGSSTVDPLSVYSQSPQVAAAVSAAGSPVEARAAIPKRKLTRAGVLDPFTL